MFRIERQRRYRIPFGFYQRLCTKEEPNRLRPYPPMYEYIGTFLNVSKLNGLPTSCSKSPTP